VPWTSAFQAAETSESTDNTDAARRDTPHGQAAGDGRLLEEQAATEQMLFLKGSHDFPLPADVRWK